MVKLELDASYWDSPSLLKNKHTICDKGDTIFHISDVTSKAVSLQQPRR